MIKIFSDDIDAKKVLFISGGILWSLVAFFFTLNSYGAGNWSGVSENPILIIGIVVSFILIFIILGIWDEIAVSLRKVSITEDGRVSIPGKGIFYHGTYAIFSKFIKYSKRNGYYYEENNGKRNKNTIYFDFTKDNILEARLARENEVMSPLNKPLSQKYAVNTEKSVFVKFKNPLPYIGPGSLEGMDKNTLAQFPDFVKQMQEKIVPEKPIEAVFVSVKEPQKLIEELGE
ncbi:MAG TPA: hypothetical protein VJH23_00205 [archaeon]|nr:hypothetical protein [archaeon]